MRDTVAVFGTQWGEVALHTEGGESLYISSEELYTTLYCALILQGTDQSASTLLHFSGAVFWLGHPLSLLHTGDHLSVGEVVEWEGGWRKTII